MSDDHASRAMPLCPGPTSSSSPAQDRISHYLKNGQSSTLAHILPSRTWRLLVAPVRPALALARGSEALVRKHDAVLALDVDGGAELGAELELGLGFGPGSEGERSWARG